MERYEKEEEKRPRGQEQNEERKRVGVWYSRDAIIPSLEGGVYPI